MISPRFFRLPGVRLEARRRASRRLLLMESLEGRQVLSTFTVININDSGPGSLRQAIIASNSAPGAAANSITFDIGVGGAETISPKSALPTITQAVVIDGTTQPGVGSTPGIVLNGSSAGSGTTGLVFQASNSTVKGLVIDSFGQSGVLISGASADTITDDFIGVAPSGAVAAGNGYDGVHLTSGAQGNVISEDVISANLERGVDIDGGSKGNTVEGSMIGTDSTGSLALGNAESGVYIEDKSDSNLVGGTSPGAANVLSGNDGRSVHIDSASEHNLVEGNMIGTNASGTRPLGNTDSGVMISDGASDNTVGGSTLAARNVISANACRGVHVNDASGNLVEGNFIGTDVTGTEALGNGVGNSQTGVCSGVLLDGGADDNVIGGAKAGDGNLISGNDDCGVHIDGGSDGNLVEGNDIGTAAGGTGALPNSQDGVLIDGGSDANTIGGAGPAANLISGNGTNGVELNGAGPGNEIEGDVIDENASNGVAIENSSNTTLSGCVIEDNAGWGILISDSSNVTLTGDATSPNGLGGVNG